MLKISIEVIAQVFHDNDVFRPILYWFNGQFLRLLVVEKIPVRVCVSKVRGT